ncbi:hypothetical protein [Comamonas aquatica]|uniref:hypothetical protein n=1 Tax=Comamonas aquatica TaxID=225991 RepID=UPI0034D5E61A
MTKHVQSTRLSVCRWFVAAALGCLALNAHAIDQIYNWNGLEFVRSGNAHHVHPASPESTRLRGGWVLEISDVEPKVTGKHDLPYQHKGGPLAKVNVATNLNKSGIAKAASAVTAAAAAGQIKPGNPYVTLAQVSATALSPFILDALADWGITKLKALQDGSFVAEVPDPTAQTYTSDGYRYMGFNGVYYLTAPSACASFSARYSGTNGNEEFRNFSSSVTGTKCYVSYEWRPVGGVKWYSSGEQLNMSSSLSSCPIGSPIVGDVCNATASTVDTPLPRVFEDNIVNKPWGPVQASVVKALIENGHNVFTDGTDTTITGPDSVPLNTTKSSWPVNVLPGTTTPAPAGHTGATDSGTQTTTTTTTAKNTFSPSGSSSGGSGSSGGPASLGSMTTTQQSTTTTTITNNITNNTSSSVTNNVTETDEAPKEEQKDFCEKNPDALACAELDTPEQETPTGQLNISYEYVDIFGNGSCPSDSYLNTHGQSLKVWDWAATCQNVQSYFRPILIACCAFAAFVIVSAGAKE